jgi:hypothetical protein
MLLLLLPPVNTAYVDVGKIYVVQYMDRGADRGSCSWLQAALT